LPIRFTRRAKAHHDLHSHKIRSDSRGSATICSRDQSVMAGLDPAIHVCLARIV
jgi:hypothetical protein